MQYKVAFLTNIFPTQSSLFKLSITPKNFTNNNFCRFGAVFTYIKGNMKHSLTEGLLILALIILFWGIGLRMTSDAYLASGNMMIVAGALLFGFCYYRRFIQK